MIKIGIHARLLAVALMLAPVAGSLLTRTAHAQSAEQDSESRNFVAIARRVMPSVVNITIGDQEKLTPDEMRQRYRDLLDHYNDPSTNPYAPPMPFGESSGSGVLIRRSGDKGYILTNNHVIDGPGMDERPINVTFHLPDETGTEYNRAVIVGGEQVRIIGRDQLSDLAVLEIDLPAGELDTVEPVEFADSDKSAIGERVLAFGNPLDLTSTMTQGIISAKSRYLSANISLERLLQTDAMIQPGNSGGPLVNLDGKIVGINNAIASRNGMWQGISFSIPSNDAKRISDQLIDFGRVMRGFLGIEMTNVRMRPDLVSLYGITDSEGVLVTKVVEDTPAIMAGIAKDDVVRRIDGRPIRDSDDMLRVIANKSVNAGIDIEVLRLDDARRPFTFKTTAVLTERPQPNILRQLAPPSNPQDMFSPSMGEHGEFLGMTIRSIQSGALGLPVVTSVRLNSPAAAAGLQVDDLITHVNGTAVSGVEEIEAILESGTGPWTFTVRREGQNLKLKVEPTP